MHTPMNMTIYTTRRGADDDILFYFLDIPPDVYTPVCQYGIMCDFKIFDYIKCCFLYLQFFCW